MPFVKTEMVMRGEKQAIYDVIKDMVSYPKFMKNLESVEVLEQDGNTDLTHWVSNVDGRKIVWTERDVFYPEEFRITYSQTDGDLKKMEGAWEMETIPEGVRVSLSVDFEFGIPMIAGLLNPILVRKVKENCNAMLQAVKEQVEHA
ncbi:MAG: type II toxin-antitoxin system RatA family toxin [Succiniclasticum sp.]|jgi:coenzyme Q-binding protein COQ10